MSAPRGGMAADFAAASRESLTALRSRLDETSQNASGDDLATVGTSLEEVADLLARETVLTRTLADSSADVTARESLSRNLFDSRVDRRTAEIVTAASSSTWSRPEDLVEALRTLAREALLVAAESEGRLDAVEDELFRLGRIVSAQPDLERLLADPGADTEGKKQVLDRLIADRTEPTTRRLAAQLVAHPTGHGIAAGFERLAELAAQRRERSVATVRSSVALSDAQSERLASVLARIYHREITVHLEVDPELLGGLVIQVGDEVIDGSVSGRLDDLARRLG